MNNDNKLLTFYGDYSLKYWIELLLDKNVELPSFQREYVWSPLMVKELVNTLVNEYYIPPVLIANNNIDGGRKNLILDGQQRLTTILLCYFKVFPKPEMAGDDWQKELIHGWTVNNIVEDINGLDLVSIESEYRDIICEKLVNQEFEHDGKKYSYVKFNDEIINGYISEHADEKDSFVNAINNDNLFDDKRLGYAYIKYEKPDDNLEIKAFAHIFRIINTSGVDLTKLQSRRALYVIGNIKNTNSKFNEYFEPEFTKKMQDYQGDPIDFASLLVYTAEYFYRKNNFSNKVTHAVARGYSDIKEREKYFEKYVLLCIQDEEDKNYFGKFSEIVKEPMIKIKKVKDYIWIVYNKYIDLCISKGQKRKKVQNDQNELLIFNNVIELQYLLFGLLYWVVYEGKDVYIDEELVKDLYSNIDLQKSILEWRQYNMITHVRTRLEKSICLYEDYLCKN